MRSGAEESAAHRRQELLRPAEFRPPGPAHLVGTLLRRPPGGTIRLIRRTPKRRATANPRSRPPRTGSTKRVRYIKDHSATAMAPTASPRSLDTETAAIGHRASRRPRPADVRSGSDRTYTESLLPPARLRCAGVGLASADVERSRGIVQPRASAAGVGRPAAACRVVRMPLRTTEAGDRSSLLEDRPGSNRRFVPSRTSRPDRGIAFRAMVGRQARPPASSSSDIMPAAQPAIDVHHGHDAFYDVEPRPGAVPGDGSSVQQPAGQSPDVAQLRGPVVHLLHAHVGCRVSRRTGRRRESCPRTPGARRRSCRGRGTRPRAW